MSRVDEYKSLLQFCSTDLQKERMEALIKAGTPTKAAKVLGMSAHSLRGHIARLRTAATARGWSPDFDLTHPVAPGQHIHGVSTNYDADGNLSLIHI